MLVFQVLVFPTICSPLQHIAGFAQALKEDYSDRLDKIGQDYLHRITKAAIHIDELIQDLLTHSRRQRLQVNLHPTPRQRVLDQALQILEREILNRNAIIHIKQPIPQVLGEEILLKQIFVNLISNATEFAPPDQQP